MTDDVTIQRWVALFADSVIQQTEAIRNHDARIGNVNARRGVALIKRLRAVGDRGRDALIPLLEHQRADVRVAAAAYLLRYRTADALKVLRRESEGDGLAAFEAAQVIKRWEEGSWQLDPPDQ